MTTLQMSARNRINSLLRETLMSCWEAKTRERSKLAADIAVAESELAARLAALDSLRAQLVTLDEDISEIEAHLRAAASQEQDGEK